MQAVLCVDTRNDPIEFTHEDQLGRGSTAKVFARALLANPRRPMIVAVFGPWGSGKTSFANLLSAELRAVGSACVWFNPWQFTNIEALTLAFFDLLATSLSRPKDTDAYAIRESFYRYAEGVTSLSLVHSPPVSHRRRGLRPPELSGLLAQPALQEQRDALVKMYAGNPRPVIVFIDDIDRLFSIEIRLLIQLVKSNADFPNLKFVLLFQKETIEAALKTDGQSGGDFLEKIIEVSIELPLIRGGRYVTDLLKEVAEIFGELAELSAADNDRWQRLLQAGILKPFTTLRQKNRLIDRLHLHRWNIESSIDINLVDLLALEILRAIDYELYAAVRRHGHGLTEAGEAARTRQYQEDDGSAFLADVLADGGSTDKRLGREILLSLFPCFGPTGASSSPIDNERAFRICRSKHFPKYFFEGLLPDEMSRSDRHQLEKAATKGETILTHLVSFQERGLLFEALEFLRTIAHSLPANRWRSIAVDLSKAADAYGRRREKGFDRSVVKECAAVLAEMLVEALPDERTAVLRAIVLDGSTVQLAAMLVAEDDSNARFQPKVSQAIGRAAEQGALEHFEQYGFLLFRWNEWGGRKASGFVRSIADDPRRFANFIRAIAPYSREESGISQSTRTRYRTPVEGILEFLPKRTAIKVANSAAQAFKGQRDEAFLRRLVEELRNPPPPEEC
jgi:hypothetical protein